MSKQSNKKNAPRRDVYADIAERVIESLENGSAPWLKPWKGGNDLPRNLRSGKAYRGINVWLLLMTADASGYGSPYWLTFKQAKELGGSVRKGEHGTRIVFWKPIKRTEVDEKGEEKERGGMLARVYTVFNLEQTDGVRIPKGRIPEPTELDELPVAEENRDVAQEVVELLEAYVEGQGIAVSHGGSRAYYRPSTDAIRMPEADDFDTLGHYASTLAHECGHSTGHGKRLARKEVADPTAFGSHEYGVEELVAEFTATFVCGINGLDRSDIVENSAAYLRSWREKIAADHRLVVTAAQRAQKAADMILGDVEGNEKPADQIGSGEVGLAA